MYIRTAHTCTYTYTHNTMTKQKGIFLILLPKTKICSHFMPNSLGVMLLTCCYEHSLLSSINGCLRLLLRVNNERQGTTTFTRFSYFTSHFNDRLTQLFLKDGSENPLHFWPSAAKLNRSTSNQSGLS